MKLTELHIKDYNQFEDFKLDLTYPKGHPKVGQALDKVCFIGQSGTGKTSLIEIVREVISLILTNSKHSLAINSSSYPIGLNFDRLSSVGQIKVSFDNQIKCYAVQLEQPNPQDGTKQISVPYHLEFKGFNNDFIEFAFNQFKFFYYPSNIKLIKTYSEEDKSNNLLVNIEKYIYYNFENFDLDETWALINKSIIEDRELEIKKSLEISKALQNPKLTNEDILKVREEFFNWRKNSPNPIVDLAENFLDKILNRFNLKVKTELDFERKEDIETIKIQTRQGEDIPFEGLSTGTKQVILTALPLYGLKPEKAIILFDEPERSLYPDIQKEIVDFYTSIATDSQFFFATHSPLIASSFEPWEIVELKFNEKGKVYQEKYYEGEKHVDNYTINPQYLTWTGILQKVFDLEQESNPLRDRQLIELATLESKLKHNSLTPEKKKETFEKYQKLATLLNWELK
jgi:predicted ATPase